MDWLSLAAGLVASVVATAVAHATRRRERLAGDGYLWYGLQRVLAGDQPVRDVRAYEPGRYWIAALVARLLRDDGLAVLRLSQHLVLGAALVAVTAAWAAVGAAPWATVAFPVIVIGWNVTPHKVVDVAALLLVVAGGTALLGGLAGGGWLLGAAVGIAATVGLNLALYGVVAGGLVVVVGAATGLLDLTDVVTVVLGSFCGTAPLAVWGRRHPGVLRATFRARVTVPAARGTTNLPLPMPWPWRPGPGAVTAASTIVGWALVVAPTLAVVLVVIAVWGGSRTTLATTVPLAVVGLAALHHGTSRADIEHLSRPLGLLSAVPIVTPGVVGAVAALVVTGLALVITHRHHPRLHRRRHPGAHVRRRLGHEDIWLFRRQAAQLDLLRLLRDGRADDAVAVVPRGVWLLAAERLHSAVFDTESVYEARREDDDRMRDELDAARPVVVIVDDVAIDGDADRRFSLTHPRTWAWLVETGELVPVPAAVERLPDAVSAWRVHAP